MKRAFVVMGMVSSGTRLMARIMTAAGCVGDGNHDHTQRWDTQQPEADLIVIRKHRPVPPIRPSWTKYPNVVQSLRHIGYEVHAIIITRDWYCSVESALAAPHVETKEEGYGMAMMLWREMIIDMPRDTPFTIVSYESLVQRPRQVVTQLFKHLGLTQIHDIEAITDGNEKYYQ